jgi:hypothetical protein
MMIVEFAEFLRIHPQFSGHLNLGVTQVMSLSSVNPNLQILWNAILRQSIISRKGKWTRFSR